MTQFDMSSAWNDAAMLLRSDLALTSALVGAMVLLPALAFALIGPVPIEPAAGADFAQIVEALRAELVRLAPVILLTSLLASLGGVAVMRLWLAPSGVSVGEALGFALALLPTLLVIFAIQMVAVSLAAMALLLPAFYLNGRWAPTLAVLAAGGVRSPIAALADSWQMTRGNGWRIALMLVLVQLVVLVITLIVDGFGSLLGVRGSLGYAIASLISAAVAAAAALVAFAVNAAIFRQLSLSGMTRTFE